MSVNYLYDLFINAVKHAAGYGGSGCDCDNSGGGSSAPSDWNASEGQPGHVLNRTHWVETVAVDPTFDGNLTGRESIFLGPDFNDAYVIKITPQYVTVDELIGSTMVLNMGGTEQSMTLTAEMAMDSSAVLGVSGSVVLQGTDPIVLSLANDSNIQGVTFSAGTWFMCIPGGFHVKSLSCLQAAEAEVVHKIDPKFMPADYPTVKKVTTNPVFDGVPFGKENIQLGNGAYAVRVTDQSVGVDELIGTTMTVWIEAEERQVILTADTAVDATDVYGVTGAVAYMEEFGDEIPFVISLSEPVSILNVYFNSGTWFLCYPGIFYTKSLSCFDVFEIEIVNKLSEKVLPDSALTYAKYNELRTHWTDEDGTVHKLDAKYVPSDWLAMHKTEHITFIEKNTVTSSSSRTNLDSLYKYTIDTFKPDLEGNGFCQVFFDNVQYNYLKIKKYDTVGNKFYAGNGYLYNDTLEDTGEPFCIVRIGSKLVMYTTDETNTDHTIEVLIYHASVPDTLPLEYFPRYVDKLVIRATIAGDHKLYQITVDSDGNLKAVLLPYKY